MYFNIEPKLKARLDLLVAKDRSTAAKNDGDQELLTSALLFCVGHDLAKLKLDGFGNPQWVGTNRFYKRSSRVAEQLLRSHEKGKRGPTFVSNSLSIIIDKFIECAPQIDGSHNEPHTRDSVLLIWAGLGLASALGDDPQEAVTWIFQPLSASGKWRVKEFRGVPTFQKWLVTQMQAPNMDELLKAKTNMIIDEFVEAIVNRSKAPGGITSQFFQLLMGEWFGGVVAYRDASGNLTWKTSPKMLAKNHAARSLH